MLRQAFNKEKISANVRAENEEKSLIGNTKPLAAKIRR
jgi:hypothetical protein